jgi:hypothetical protein
MSGFNAWYFMSGPTFPAGLTQEDTPRNHRAQGAYFGASNIDPGETITFNAASTKTVTQVMTSQPRFGNQIGSAAIPRC